MGPSGRIQPSESRNGFVLFIFSYYLIPLQHLSPLTFNALEPTAPFFSPSSLALPSSRSSLNPFPNLFCNLPKMEALGSGRDSNTTNSKATDNNNHVDDVHEVWFTWLEIFSEIASRLDARSVEAFTSEQETEEFFLRLHQPIDDIGFLPV